MYFIEKEIYNNRMLCILSCIHKIITRTYNSNIRPEDPRTI